uniref:Uncharacterized protein n=1 Tax=Arcella intermedia TaxID=1963864 RepID=A0A6B2LW37_9EUKA
MRPATLPRAPRSLPPGAYPHGRPPRHLPHRAPLRHPHRRGRRPLRRLLLPTNRRQPSQAHPRIPV